MSSMVTGVTAAALTRSQVARRFRALLTAGAELRPAGVARHDPEILLSRRYLPRHAVRLFDATYLLNDFRYDVALGFFVGYVVLGEHNGRRVDQLYPRIFYKDSSLMWRVASHFVHDHEEYWIGKGDVREEIHDGVEVLVSAEETTNLPFEIQSTLDEISRRVRRQRDDDAVELVLRQGPTGRIQPYADFVRPRRRAAARGAIHGGRPVAGFRRRGDPASLRFVAGYEPDFGRGAVEVTRSFSKFFGGELCKYRFLSVNGEIQYLFFASPTHAWINPPQALTTELSNYGVRTVDVAADGDIFLPGYEYHETGSSQIPAGYAGDAHPKDPHRADASAWIEALPIIQEFRKKVLGRRHRRR
jgi:hypothetical protein